MRRTDIENAACKIVENHCIVNLLIKVVNCEVLSVSVSSLLSIF